MNTGDWGAWGIFFGNSGLFRPVLESPEWVQNRPKEGAKGLKLGGPRMGCGHILCYVETIKPGGWWPRSGSALYFLILWLVSHILGTLASQKQATEGPKSGLPWPKTFPVRFLCLSKQTGRDRWWPQGDLAPSFESIFGPLWSSVAPT